MWSHYGGPLHPPPRPPLLPFDNSKAPKGSMIQGKKVIIADAGRTGARHCPQQVPSITWDLGASRSPQDPRGPAGSQGSLVGSVFLILLPSGAVSVWKGGSCSGAASPSSRRQGRACWQIVEHLSRDSIICTTSFIWLSSRSDQTWKLRGMRLEGILSNHI